MARQYEAFLWNGDTVPESVVIDVHPNIDRHILALPVECDVRLTINYDWWGTNITVRSYDFSSDYPRCNDVSGTYPRCVGSANFLANTGKIQWLNYYPHDSFYGEPMNTSRTYHRRLRKYFSDAWFNVHDADLVK